MTKEVTFANESKVPHADPKTRRKSAGEKNGYFGKARKVWDFFDWKG